MWRRNDMTQPGRGGPRGRGSPRGSPRGPAPPATQWVPGGTQYPTPAGVQPPPPPRATAQIKADPGQTQNPAPIGVQCIPPDAANQIMGSPARNPSSADQTVIKTENPVLVTQENSPAQQDVDAALSAQEQQNASMDTGTNLPNPAGVKRGAEDPQSEPKRKKFRKAFTGPVKLPAMKLQELRKGVTFEYLPPEGPVHAPSFTCIAKVEDHGDYVGKASSKKMSKHAASEAVLRDLYPSSELLDVIWVGEKSESPDFSSDTMESDGFIGVKKTKTVITAALQGDSKSVVNLHPDEKNPAQLLNEVSRATCSYELVESLGVPPNTIFTMKVIVNGQEYNGKGRSKRLAKASAARAALIGQYGIIPKSDPEENGQGTPEGRPPITAKAAQADVTKHPTMLLNEKRPGVVYDLISETRDANRHPTFTMKVTVDGVEYTGQGPNKRAAKAAAARVALSELFGMKFSPLDLNPVSQGIDTSEGDQEGMDMPSIVADKYAFLVLQKCDELTARNEVLQRRKVVAGVVMSKESSFDVKGEDLEPEVVAVATGTKTLEGSQISNQGNTLNDCHGEVLCRRAFVHYLYTQLEKALNTNTASESILERRPDGKYMVKPGIKFHIYISTAPCGDARIFSVNAHDMGLTAEDTHPNRSTRGVLRNKIESGEGTIPVRPEEAVQTWDGIIAGGRLLTMSCSDKMCLWNLVGVQGALLSYFLEPIRYHTLIIGTYFHPVHLRRALHNRIKGYVCNLPPGYVLEMPNIAQVSSPECRRAMRSPSAGINWYKGANLESVNASSGQLLDKPAPSRLCKRNTFVRWLGLALKHPDLIPQPSSLYSEAKEGATAYQAAKKAVIKAFGDAGLGKWAVKPLEVDEFSIVI